MPALSPSPSRPSLGSLYGNNIGDEGASALAAVLKETKITNLKCAAAPECSLLCQRPLTRLTTRLRSRPCTHAVWNTTTSAPRVEPLLLTG